MFRRACASLLAVAAVPLGLAGVDPASAADPSVALSLQHFNGIAVAGGHVFIADATAGNVIVRNLDGSADSVITEPTPTGIAASSDGLTVYVALGSANQIAVIDAADATESARYSTGANSCPTTVAPLGTALYFGYGCSNWSGGIGVVDTTAATPTVTSGLVTGLVSPPVIAASDAVASRIFAAATAGDTVQAYDIGSDGALTAAGPPASVGGNFHGMAITSDGADLVTASGSPYHHPRFKTSDLSADGEYTTSAYPNAVAAGPNGWVAAGIDGDYAPDVYVFDGARSATRSYEFGSSNSCCNIGDSVLLTDNGLAFGPTALYAITHDIDGSAFRLRVLRDALKYPVGMSVTGPVTAPRAHAITVTGKLTVSGGVLANVVLTVRKTDLAGTHTLTAVKTTSAGAFTIHDSPAVGGTNTYTVSYAGDATRAAVTKSVKIAVSRASTALSISTNHTTYANGQRESVKVHLGTTYNGRTVTVSAREYGSSKYRVVRTARVDSHGNLSTSLVAHRNVTIAATFAGDYRYAPRTITVRRSVRAVIKSAIAGTYGTSHGYHLMHAKKGGAIAVQVKPLKPGRTVRFRLEVLKNGSWRTADTARETLNDYGVIAVSFIGKPYTQLRIRGEFTGDGANAAIDAKWWYVEFR